MTTTQLKADDIKIFSDAAMTFFSHTTGHKAAVRTAYMLDGAETVVWNDFQGRIELSGDYRGSVTFSAPRGLLTHVLLRVRNGATPTPVIAIWLAKSPIRCRATRVGISAKPWTSRRRA